MNAHSPLILFVSVIQREGFMTACQSFPLKIVWWQQSRRIYETRNRSYCGYIFFFQ